MTFDNRCDIILKRVFECQLMRFASDFLETVVLIPAYKPNELLLKTIDEIRSEDFRVLVIDDGSGEKYASVFEEAAKQATVLHHAKNKGKGAALKFGFSKIGELFPDCKYIITADADGQHAIKDICAVRTELRSGAEFVVGSREFSGDIPLRSRVGNNMSRFMFAIVTGCYLRDNQMGLRGFKAEHTDWLSLPSGSRYDYEMNVLMYAARQNIPITEVTAETIYIDDNSSSHFNPALDTLRIYKRMFRTAWASLVSVVLAFVLVFIYGVFRNWSVWPIAISFIQVVSAGASLLLNKMFCYKGIRQRCLWRTMLSTGIRMAVYLDLMVLQQICGMPWMFAAYVISAVICLPIEYKSEAKRS